MRGSFAALEDDGEKQATANATATATATAKEEADPCGMTTKKSKDNGNPMENSEIEVEEGLGGMVTVARFTDPSEGQMAKGALEAAGLEAFLQGENANRLYPGMLGGQLLVNQRDEAEAREILDGSGELEPGAELEDEGA